MNTLILQPMYTHTNTRTHTLTHYTTILTILNGLKKSKSVGECVQRSFWKSNKDI